MSSLESDIKYCVSKYGARLDDYIVDTVFFGGGTPSYVSPQLIAGILKTLKSEFAFDENPEISMFMLKADLTDAVSDCSRFRMTS